MVYFADKILFQKWFITQVSDSSLYRWLDQHALGPDQVFFYHEKHKWLCIFKKKKLFLCGFIQVLGDLNFTL